jgi:snRNA-activating protein complex subunit 3
LIQKLLAYSVPPNDSHQALLFITIYNTVSWGHRLLSRASQHALLSSQSLGDLFDAIPCSSNEMPEEYSDHEGNIHWEDPTLHESTGSVVCIEGVAYGDGQTERDYSE